MVATDFGLYITEDGGTTWTKETKIPNVCIYNIKMRASDRKLFIFTHGRGVWVANVLPYNTVKPTANFTFTNSQACEGEIVTFTNMSGNNPAQYKWSFENGNPAASTSAMAATSFSGAGVKKIKLVVTNSFGSDSIEKSITIIANPKPILILTGNTLQSSITSTSYTWYRNNTVITPQTQSILADITGWYKLKINNGNGCFATSDSIQVFAVGINQMEFNSRYYFHPNPANNNLTLYATENAKVSIYTMDGKLISNIVFTQTNPMQIDISSLPKGIYLVAFRSETESYTYKLLKQ